MTFDHPPINTITATTVAELAELVGLIEPVSVVDDAQQRAPLGDIREQAQHAQANQKSIRSHTGGQAEHDLERPALRSR